MKQLPCNMHDMTQANILCCFSTRCTGLEGQAKHISGYNLAEEIRCSSSKYLPDDISDGYSIPG